VNGFLFFTNANNEDDDQQSDIGFAYSVCYFQSFKLCRIESKRTFVLVILIQFLIVRCNRHRHPSLFRLPKLTAADGGQNNNFGSENAVSISNNRIVVGSYGYESNRGAVYLFGDPNNPQYGRSYSQLAILTASDGQTGHHFGESVVIEGETIVVGAIGYLTFTGAVYVYRISDINKIVAISQVAKLTASNGMKYDSFGRSVAINGNTMVVGAPYVDKNNSYDVGSAYLFVNPSNDLNSPEWTQLQQFQPNDSLAGGWFGYSVAMDTNIAVIGTSALDANAAYLFVPANTDETVNSSSSSSSWAQLAKLTGSTGSVFGYTVAVTGNRIIVGAPWDQNSNGNKAGAVFVFTKSSFSWTQMAQLFAVHGAVEYNFGRSVAVSKDGSTIMVGASGNDFNTTITDSGAAYLFRITNWTTTTTSATTTIEYTQMGKFVAADQNTNDYLGASIAIENNIVVVGAYGDDSASGIQDTGSAYILDTGFSSPTTIAPTADSQSTPSPTPKQTPRPTSTLTTNNDNGTPPPLLITHSPTSIAPVPTTATISPSNLNTNSPTTEEASNADSGTAFTPGVIAGMAAIVIVGVVVVLGVLGILNYRIKVRRKAREQEQSMNDVAAGPAGDEIPIMAEVVMEPHVSQPVNERTLDVEDAFLDLAPAVMAKTPPAPFIDHTSQEKLPEFKDQVIAVEPSGPSAHVPSLPRFKDQVMSVEPPRRSTNIPSLIASERTKRKSQQQIEKQTEPFLDDQSLPVPQQQHMQSHQQFHPSGPSANIPSLPRFKDQVMTVEPPRLFTNIPSSMVAEESKRNSQQQIEKQTEPCLKDQQLPAPHQQHTQSQQQYHPDPPAASEQHRQQLTFKDQVSL
jgi:hypothetical protein